MQFLGVSGKAKAIARVIIIGIRLWLSSNYNKPHPLHHPTSFTSLIWRLTEISPLAYHTGEGALFGLALLVAI